MLKNTWSGTESSVTNILKTEKPPLSNITKQETKAVTSLTKGNNITILLTVEPVILDTKTDEKQMEEML